jgi:AcrR family transcriptional regulator
MPKGFSEQERAQIHQRLLEQGYRLFSAYGLKKATVEELAAAAGISKGAFYLFYDSKEALFMDVIEETAEKRLRQELVAAVDLPGPTPRARLLAIFQRAFAIFRTVPLLQSLTGSDYDVLMRRLPPERLQRHMAGDRAFFDELLERCRRAGIPIRASVAEISELLYALILGALHEDGWPAWDSGAPGQAFATLLELVAAYCLGEVTLEGADARDRAARLNGSLAP